MEEKLTGSPAYKPSQTELGWEVIVGAVVATVPLIVASYEFGKRIVSLLTIDSSRSITTCESASCVHAYATWPQSVWAKESNMRIKQVQGPVSCFARSLQTLGCHEATG